MATPPVGVPPPVFAPPRNQGGVDEQTFAGPDNDNEHRPIGGTYVGGKMTEQQGRELEPNQDLQEAWTEICESLRVEIGEASYQSWIKPMRLLGGDGVAVRAGVPTRFMREWIQAHYQEKRKYINQKEKR